MVPNDAKADFEIKIINNKNKNKIFFMNSSSIQNYNTHYYYGQ